MTHLSQLQSDFQAYLRASQLSDKNVAASFKNQIVNDVKVGAHKRLNIYADAYRLRIIEALAGAYPKLKLLVGDDYFDQTARSYINQYPSTHCNMRWVGSEMAVHLQHILPQHPIAAEMAQFEWALGLAFDATDAPIKTLQDLAAIPPENWLNLQFILHPSVQLLALNYNVVAIWNALNSETTPPSPVAINEPCLVWRQGLEDTLNAHFQTINWQEFNLIKQIAMQATFGALCESVANANAILSTSTSDNATDETQAMVQVATYVSNWLHCGLISDIQI